MNRNTLWSLRLGFSGKHSDAIGKKGLEKFLSDSFSASYDKSGPKCLDDDPKTLAEFQQYRQRIKDSASEENKKALRRQLRNALELRVWWLDKMTSSEFPLREKMTVFWHNHFVASAQKVKMNWWIYQHNAILRQHAFGNLKTLTKAILKSNAMVRYLDNTDNRVGKINENLSRELLELFTIGIGNYSEDDIKNGAKALAGLHLGNDSAVYRPKFEDNEVIVYFGKSGKFKADDLVDIIFDQPNAPYHITRKILKWFIYDNPDEKLVKYYGDFLRESNFELKPFLTKIFTEEFAKDSAGSKIKDPLTYVLQLWDELKIKRKPSYAVAVFLRQQGMDLFNQPNVKGWDGGRSWLTSQIFLQRNTVADALCAGKNINRGKPKELMDENETPDKETRLDIELNFPKNGDNLEIISALTDRLLFTTDKNLQDDFEKLLKYDFDPKSPGAENTVLRLFNDMVKTPEFQLI
ncbi:DUF1800 domain-containing protein [Flavobacterium sp.]|uniref:DUF1800 domain-containing protein n=1 Tax=Flavobacterium sp. TaxID=239 RepID=UPI00120DD627|nr:DUF1800 domain-containing protein [Flavobacterium sp.]RZJ70906.1 MAG: DUF1800 domain-containing protein [Flavobacterium sp.]